MESGGYFAVSAGMVGLDVGADGAGRANFLTVEGRTFIDRFRRAHPTRPDMPDPTPDDPFAALSCMASRLAVELLEAAPEGCA
jgi:hypothetical protein